MKLDSIVGANIRKYRKANHLTLQTLSEKINKSVSTISKYEKGLISVDVTTLSEIADVLHILPMQLLQETEREVNSRHEACGIQDVRYLYSYDAEQGCLIRSVIERVFYLEEPDKFEAVLFNDVEDIHKPDTCSSFYSGSGIRHGTIENYYFHNENHASEHVMINSISNLVKHKMQWAMVAGLSNNLMLPISFKAILSENVIANEKELIDKLKISREELQYIRKNHCMLVKNG